MVDRIFTIQYRETGLLELQLKVLGEEEMLFGREQWFDGSLVVTDDYQLFHVFPHGSGQFAPVCNPGFGGHSLFCHTLGFRC